MQICPRPFWRHQLNLKVIEYRDRTTYHRDKEFLGAMTVQQLLMLAIRSVIAGEQLTVEAPYHASNTKLEWMTGWLRDHFNGIFGRGVPMLQVVCTGR